MEPKWSGLVDEPRWARWLESQPGDHLAKEELETGKPDLADLADPRSRVESTDRELRD